MYGDMMYCETCGGLFMDVWRLHDTRVEKQLLSNCPKCMSMHTMNADAFIEKYEEQDTQNRYSYTVLYNHLKRVQKEFHQKKYMVSHPDVFLTVKEKQNSNRKV